MAEELRREGAPPIPRGAAGNAPSTLRSAYFYFFDELADSAVNTYSGWMTGS